MLLLLAALALAGCGDEGGDERPDLDRRLLDAAYANDVAAARELIADGADVNVKDDSEQSAYLIATSEVGPGTELLELTLANGAEVNAKDSYNGTGLIRAARARPRGDLPAAAGGGHRQGPRQPARLDRAARGGDARRRRARRTSTTVRVLVEGGVDTSIADGEGVTPLEHAERRGYAEIARILRQSE